MIRNTISHYKILQKIGEGGMGEVFLAEDTKLKRKVALKFLPKEFTKDKDAVERFQREAQAAAALNHPNIITIHEINQHEDQTYIVMEYVEGQTLKDIISENSKFNIQHSKLTIERIINITAQICEGLQKAHEAGIVHRDIKPHNILIDKDGRVKILDFGLAKLKGISQLTKESSTLGTTHYLSPEQAMNKEVDHRTDIWSLGVLLYEMLTGQLPFQGDYEQAVIYSILNEKPETLSSILFDIPKELENLVNKMLEKNIHKRLQHIDEIKTSLYELSNDLKYELKEKKMTKTPSTHKKKTLFVAGLAALVIITFLFIYIFFLSKSAPIESKSIAVLPFKNMSEDRQNEYFCDGITEDIITQLSKIRDLKVTSRTSAFYFKDKEIKIKDIARELGVATILEGSVRQTGSKVRITAQLINAQTDDHLWAETYDRDLKDIFAIQSDVASQIANTLEITLLPDVRKRISQKPTENIEAYKLYLQGKLHWNKRTEEDLEKAITFFEKAVELDPEYALGYSALAETYVVIGEIWNILMMDRDVARSNAAYQKAEQYCMKAMSLDDQLAPVYAVLAEIRTDWKWDFKGGEEFYKKAIELNPNYATAHQWMSEYYALLGKFDLASESITRAEELDPYSFIIKFMKTHVFVARRQYDKAINIIQKIIADHPKFTLARERLIDIYIMQGSYDLAYQHAKNIGDEYQQKYINFLILISNGETEKARKMLKEYIKSAPPAYKTPAMLAIAYADLGDLDQAVKWFKQAIEKKDRIVLWRYTISRRETLINDHRVKKMLKEVGLEK